jgi:hypothetical protein
MAFPTITLEPVNRCVYCGSMKDLHDEHIIAYSLDGHIVLPKASCNECGKVTSYLEGYCARRIFAGVRATKDMQTRRPKDRPKQLPIILRFKDRTETRFLPLDKHPGLYALIAYQRPGILAGRSPNDPFGPVKYKLFGKNLEEIKLNDYLLTEGAIEASLDWHFDAIIFARMLAKIAHCCAAHYVGLENFKAYLPKLILEKNTLMPIFVGTEIEHASASKFGHRAECFRHRIGELPLLVTRIQLFAQAPTPEYWVITGELSPNYRTPSERGLSQPKVF